MKEVIYRKICNKNKKGECESIHRKNITNAEVALVLENPGDSRAVSGLA